MKRKFFWTEIYQDIILIIQNFKNFIPQNIKKTTEFRPKKFFLNKRLWETNKKGGKKKLKIFFIFEEGSGRAAKRRGVIFYVDGCR